MNFAKLWGSDGDQVLVKLDTGPDSDPEVRIYFQPENLGVCSFALGFHDDDSGWDQAEAYFNSMTEEQARGLCNDLMRRVGIDGPLTDGGDR